jgi:shikimate kinase
VKDADMRLFLTGVSCVGKTTVGAKLAALLGCPFFDLDQEIERFFAMPIEPLQEQFLTMYAFRQAAAKALTSLLHRDESRDAVIALSPSGLMAPYWRVVKRAGGRIVVLRDDAKQILNRITFYDRNSIRIEKQLTEKEKALYLKEIQKDITYFNRTYKRADLSVDLSGLGPEQAAIKAKEMLDQTWSEARGTQKKGSGP